MNGSVRDLNKHIFYFSIKLNKYVYFVLLDIGYTVYTSTLITVLIYHVMSLK